MPQEEVSHHNYRPNGYAASFFIQTPLGLQGEAAGDEDGGLCVFVMGGEEQDHNVQVIADLKFWCYLGH